MPFHEARRMDTRFGICDVGFRPKGRMFAKLCRRFGVSPTTGYKWLERWRLDGKAGGFRSLSRRPRNFAIAQRGDDRKSRAFRAYGEHPAWGGRRIARRLKDLGQEALPAPSTVTAILKRHGVGWAPRRRASSAFTRFERERPKTSCGRWTSRATWPCIPAGFIP